MVLSQSFDEFHCADEFIYTGGNAWGCPDAILFNEMSKYIAEQGSSKVFHMVLTSSNHPPYTIDVDGEGFNRSEVITKLPVDIKNEEKKITELGHMWYMDKSIGDFVKTTESINENSLYVITGDHSERFHFEKEQDTKTKSAIPCVFYGKRINKEMFNNVQVGVHNQIAGTIAELIAPVGFEYSSMMGNMFEENVVWNYKLYANGVGIDNVTNNIELDKRVTDMKRICAWRIIKGENK